MSIEPSDGLLLAVQHFDGFERLPELVQGLLDEGATVDEVLGQLEQVRHQVTSEDEDKVLDVMDLLVGWCAPTRRHHLTTAGCVADLLGRR